MNQTSDNGFIIVPVTVAVTIIALSVFVYVGNKRLQEVRSQITPKPVLDAAS